MVRYQTGCVSSINAIIVAVYGLVICGLVHTATTIETLSLRAVLLHRLIFKVNTIHQRSLHNGKLTRFASLDLNILA